MAGGTQQQYKIIEATIGADRFGGFSESALTFDVRPIIIEVTLYESLDKPYVTGNIVMLDDNGLFEGMVFNGTEKLRLKIAGVNDTKVIMPPGQDDPRTYVMTGVEKAIKNDNGNSAVYAFTLIDEHAFLGRSKKISKSYSGNIGSIVRKIAQSELKKDLDVSYTFKDTGNEIKPVQENMKVVVPNLTPLDAIDWLSSRATTETGSPYFMWATIHDNRLRFGNLDTMLTQQPFNSKLPYTYNPANIGKAEGATELEKSATVKAVTFAKMSNTLKLVEAGSLSAEYANTNLNTGDISRQHYSFRDTLKKLSDGNIIVNKNQNVFDGEMLLDENKIDTYDAKKYHTLTSTGVYGSSKSYHDEFDKAKFKKKLENRAIVNHLYKNMMQVVIPGTGFFVSGAAVGDIVNIQIASDNMNVGDTKSKKTLIDANKSGKCLIYDLRHTFTETAHTVSMNVCKLESETLE